jgi:sec-independent protein translocase protein TatA
MFPDKAPLLILLVVVLVIFGPNQLPKLAKMVGKSAKSLKDGMDGTLADDDEVPAEAAKAASSEDEQGTHSL